MAGIPFPQPDAASDCVDLIIGNPSVSPLGVVRLAAPGGVPSISVNGTAYVPIALQAPVAVVANGASSLMIGPVPIAGLQGWWEADKGITYTSAATWPVVLNWADQSGLGNRDLTPVGSPAFVGNSVNGRPGVTFLPTTPSYFRNTATNLVTVDRGPRTVFIVAKARTTIGGDLFCFRSDVTSNCFYVRHLLNAGNIEVQSSGGATRMQLADVPANLSGTPHMWSFTYDGRFAVTGTDNAIRVRIDGQEKAVVSSGQTTTETGTTGFVLGAQQIATTQGWDGDISLCLIFNRVLAPFELRLLEACYSTKYQITRADPAPLWTMCLGDSGFYGQGNAASLAAGGPRKALYALHKNMILNVGSFYAPHSVSIGGVPQPSTSDDGFFNRCDGNIGYTSANNAAHGIGGLYLDTTLAATPPDLVLLMIGINDNVVDGLTAAQTAANIRAIVDKIGAAAPQARVVVLAATLLRTDHANAGTANPIIIASRALTAAALVGAQNVITSPAWVAIGGYSNIVVPPVVPDALYADTTHLAVAGWDMVIAQSWHPALQAVGL